MTDTFTYPVGTVADVRGPRGSNVVVIITAPNRVMFTIPTGASGKASVWLAQVGTWRVEWPDDPTANCDLVVTPIDAAQVVPQGKPYLEGS